MKKVIIWFTFIFIGQFLSGQQLTPVVISSAGISSQHGEYYLDVTVGEAAIMTYENEDASLAQGFHHPRIYFDVFVYEPGEDYDIKVYPNPTSGIVNIKIHDLQREFWVRVYDVLGRLVFSSVYSHSIATLDIAELEGGAYLLKVVDGEFRVLGVYGVVKM